MKNIKFMTGMICVLIAGQVYAQRTYKYPAIYPFVPISPVKIWQSVEKMSEDKDYIANFFDAYKANLSSAKTKEQPWGSTYWPLNKGLIADPYESGFFGYYVEFGTVSWTRNYKKFLKRKKGLLAHSDKLTSEQLNFLAPSEKYDLLLGDKEFDLTNRLWDLMQTWGNYKEYGYLTNLDITGEKTLETAKKLVEWEWFDSIEDAFQNAYEIQGSLAPEFALELVKHGKYETVEDAMDEAIDMAIDEASNYVKVKKNKYIAFWEGICHGWAVSSGLVSRPRNTIEFELPDNRKMKFYPTDIKAIVSLLWANSLIQDGVLLDQTTGENIGGGVLSQGLRCNLKNPKKDVWGRFYDSEPDPFYGDHSPRCSGVHPAIWHLGLVNIIGKQKRSFIVERKVGEAVDNHPMAGYEMTFFNPLTGISSKDINKNIEALSDKDQFKQFRSSLTKYIVGVETTMTYLDWKRPSRYLHDNEGMDKLVDKKMIYDLELDDNYNIVGGQWRAVKVGYPEDRDFLNHSQPDFFWVITKDYKHFFQPITDIEPWTDTTKAPPASWLERAREAHKFIYHKKYSYGTGQKCKVYNKITGKLREVSCEFEEPRPQPFINVVQKLIELSK